MSATIFGPGTARSLTQVEQDATVVAGLLAEHGVSRGTRVLYQAENSPGYVTVLLALMHAGASIVFADHLENEAGTARMYERTGSRLLVTDGALAPEGLPRLRVDELVSRAVELPPSSVDFDLSGWKELDDALIMWSSGSTGEPKGIVKNGGKFLENLLRNADLVGHRADDVLLPLLPFSHQYGLSMVMIAWLRRCSLVVAPYRRLDVVLKMASETGVTVIDATPPTYRSIRNIVTRRPDPLADLRTVRMFCSGAAPLDPALSDSYLAFAGHPLLDSYGSTELGNVCFANPENPHGTGQVVRGLGVRIVDDAGSARPATEVGEIEVDSPDMMEGFLAEDGSVDVVERGWQRTGDLGYLDERGNLFVLGRKLAVNRMGYTIYPEILENKAARGGCSVKVIPVPDDRRGTSLVFYVEDEQGRDRQYWRERLNQLLPPYEQPNRVVVLDRLPLNHNGKPDRKQLTGLAEAEMATP